MKRIYKSLLLVVLLAFLSINNVNAEAIVYNYYRVVTKLQYNGKTKEFTSDEEFGTTEFRGTKGYLLEERVSWEQLKQMEEAKKFVSELNLAIDESSYNELYEYVTNNTTETENTTYYIKTINIKAINKPKPEVIPDPEPPVTPPEEEEKVYYLDNKKVDVKPEGENLLLAKEDGNNFYYITLKITSEDNQEYTKDSKKELSFMCNGDLSLLTKVYVDDKEIDENNYEKEQGGTIIYLKSSYLDNLESGNHRLKFIYDEVSSPSTSFTIKEAKKSQIGNIIGLLFGAGLVVGLIFLSKKLKDD